MTLPRGRADVVQTTTVWLPEDTRWLMSSNGVAATRRPRSPGDGRVASGRPGGVRPGLMMGTKTKTSGGPQPAARTTGAPLASGLLPVFGGPARVAVGLSLGARLHLPSLHADGRLPRSSDQQRAVVFVSHDRRWRNIRCERARVSDDRRTSAPWACCGSHLGVTTQAGSSSPSGCLVAVDLARHLRVSHVGGALGLEPPASPREG